MFSKKTVFEIIKALNLRTHDEAERFSIEFGLDEVVSGEYIKQKETSIAKYLIANPNKKGPNGSSLAIEVIEYIVKSHSAFSSSSLQISSLANSLERDGYILTETGVRKSLPEKLPMVESEDELTNILKKHGLTTALGHYEQAIAAHGRSEWASANAQLRTFVEEFFNKVQEIVCPGDFSSTQQKKVALAKSGFFLGQYNEFLFNGTGFVEGFWKRLHPEGSHPGLSEKDDSTFRLHLVILVIHHFAERLNEQKAA